MTSDNRVRHVFLALSALLVVLAVACGGSGPTGPGSTSTSSATSSPGSGSTNPGPTQSTTGTLRVMLKDSPFSDAKAVLVEFSEVSAHMSGGDWTTLPLVEAGSRTCDLKKLTGGAQDLLGVGTLPAGHYTQLRLAVRSATIYFDNPLVSLTPCAATSALVLPLGDTAPVTVPSDTIKLNREFDVPTGGATTILLDFDGDKSINQTGNGKYMMKPVIGVSVQ